MAADMTRYRAQRDTNNQSNKISYLNFEIANQLFTKRKSNIKWTQNGQKYSKNESFLDHREPKYLTHLKLILMEIIDSFYLNNEDAITYML